MTTRCPRSALLAAGVLLGMFYAPQEVAACKVCENRGSGFHCYFTPAPNGYMTCTESAGVCTVQYPCSPNGPGSVLPEGTLSSEVAQSSGSRVSSRLPGQRTPSWAVRLVRDCRGFVKARYYGSVLAARVRHSTRSIRV